MGRTAEVYTHEFVSGAGEPHRMIEKALFLKEAIRHLSNSEAEVEVFPVYNGVVWWSNEVVFLSRGEELPVKDLKKCRRDYGIEEMPKLGLRYGYLIRYRNQIRQADDNDDRQAKVDSASDYLKLMEYVVGFTT